MSLGSYCSSVVGCRLSFVGVWLLVVGCWLLFVVGGVTAVVVVVGWSVGVVVLDCGRVVV